MRSTHYLVLTDPWVQDQEWSGSCQAAQRQLAKGYDVQDSHAGPRAAGEFSMCPL